MPLGQRERLLAAQGAQHAGPARGLHRVGQPLRVQVAADPVEDHARHVQVGVEALEAQHGGRGAPRLRARVHDQHDRRAQPLGYLRGGTVLARAVDAVEAAHDALDQAEVGACSA